MYNEILRTSREQTASGEHEHQHPGSTNRKPDNGNTAMITTDKSGSTLIEVIVAMLILAVVIVGLNAGVVSLINSNINTKELNAATTVGNQFLEGLRRLDNDSLRALVTDLDTVRARYQLDFRIDHQSSESVIDLYVNWPLASLKHQIALSTVIAMP